jgi:hypothetical protein
MVELRLVLVIYGYMFTNTYWCNNWFTSYWWKLNIRIHTLVPFTTMIATPTATLRVPGAHAAWTFIIHSTGVEWEPRNLKRSKLSVLLIMTLTAQITYVSYINSTESVKSDSGYILSRPYNINLEIFTSNSEPIWSPGLEVIKKSSKLKLGSDLSETVTECSRNN